MEVASMVKSSGQASESSCLVLHVHVLAHRPVCSRAAQASSRSLTNALVATLTHGTVQPGPKYLLWSFPFWHAPFNRLTEVKLYTQQKLPFLFCLFWNISLGHAVLNRKVQPSNVIPIKSEVMATLSEDGNLQWIQKEQQQQRGCQGGLHVRTTKNGPFTIFPT